MYEAHFRISRSNTDTAPLAHPKYLDFIACLPHSWYTCTKRFLMSNARYLIFFEYIYMELMCNQYFSGLVVAATAPAIICF
jgi:hypothetical protein